MIIETSFALLSLRATGAGGCHREAARIPKKNGIAVGHAKWGKEKGKYGWLPSPEMDVRLELRPDRDTSNTSTP